MGERIQNGISYIVIKAVQYGVPITTGLGGIGLTLDSLLRSKNGMELGIGILLTGIATVSTACHKQVGRLCNYTSDQKNPRHSGSDLGGRGAGYGTGGDDYDGVTEPSDCPQGPGAGEGGNYFW